MNRDNDESILLVNRYRLIHQVGKGGMALVYKAYDQMLERPVAVKLLKEDFLTDSGFRERFKQEAKAAANLSHPNIVTIHDFGIDSAGLFIVMELISGDDLKNILRQRIKFPEKEGLNLMIQACAGLGYAHRAGIVHCDVKPHNMLISADHRLKITDFGIARALSSISSEQRYDIVWGSPQYFSPEQALGDVPSPASDVYSLGVVMYELFTGKLPFNSNSVDELIMLHKTKPPQDPREVNPDLSLELSAILVKILSKEPSARYRTADQLGHVLNSHMDKLVNDSNFPQDFSVINPPPIYIPATITPEDYEDNNRARLDWKLIGLELLTLFMVGGLIPFWLYVLFKISTAAR